jgi:integrase
MTYKRGRIYWYKFMWCGRMVCKSTKQGSDKVARQMEAAHRTSLAKGEVGIRTRHLAPTLREFITERVDPWAQTRFRDTPNTYVRWFRPGARAICAYTPLSSRRLDDINGEHFASFAAHRQSQELAVSSVNSNLRVLSRILSLAVEWGELDAMPKMRLLPGERGRDRVVTVEEEKRYLAAAPEPLRSIAAVLFDTGLRTDEAYRLSWETITWSRGRYGALQVLHGKTAAARRWVPMTTRVRAVLESRWLDLGKPEMGYAWPAETKAGYINDETVRRMHLKVLEESGVKHFVLHSLRHTFLTRLGESGCDVWTMARLVGHSSTKALGHYVHPSQDAAEAAILRLKPAVAALPTPHKAPDGDRW